jgi:NAD(P)-dependent dehydrogenase (short-subunit alcohol dehydrogenase family)
LRRVASAEGRFGDRVALVTGAAKGIGRAVALRLAAEGARVIGLDRDSAALEELGGRIAPCVVDVSDADALRAAIGDAGPLDVLVNNAGVQRPGVVDELPLAEWDLLHAVHARAAFVAIAAATPSLAARGGSVVNVASVDGLTAEAGVAAYCAAKAGLVNLTRGAALDLAARGVRVNAVCPGMVDTPMLRSFLDAGPVPEQQLAARLRRVPLGRLVAPEEVASAVAFLASAEASAITGATLVVDNGLTAGWDYAPDTGG